MHLLDSFVNKLTRLNLISFAILITRKSTPPGLEASGRSGSIQGLGQTCETATDGRALCKCAAGTCSESGDCGGFQNPFAQALGRQGICLRFNLLAGQIQTSILFSKPFKIHLSIFKCFGAVAAPSRTWMNS